MVEDTEESFSQERLESTSWHTACMTRGTEGGRSRGEIGPAFRNSLHSLLRPWEAVSAVRRSLSRTAFFFFGLVMVKILFCKVRAPGLLCHQHFLFRFPIHPGQQLWGSLNNHSTCRHLSYPCFTEIFQSVKPQILLAFAFLQAGTVYIQKRV